MLNFTVGPVMMDDCVRAIGGDQIPYFRTPEFSRIMLENEKRMCAYFGAESGARTIFLTGSGTAAMEAAVVNTLTGKDKVLVVNGGSFGQRFCDICRVHSLRYEAIVCEAGKTLTAAQLAPYENKGFTAFLVNLGETSTGVLYDISLIADFCRRNGLFLIVDSISSFLADPFSMQECGADIVLTGSQKALALAPGLSVLCCNRRAQERIAQTEAHSLYFDLKSYLCDGERGQTPFTPAVSVLLQMHARLREIEARGGVDEEVHITSQRAVYFRKGIEKLPFALFADRPSAAVTALTLTDPEKSAYRVFEVLKDEYGIFVCPNGGALKNRVFRVGHIGALRNADYDRLLDAFGKLAARGVI